MGADVLEESNTKETAGDVAERCNANKEIIQILKAAEGFPNNNDLLIYLY